MAYRIRRRAPWGICTVLALTLVTTVACRDITTLKQEDPSQLDAGKLFVPANAQLLVNGAISDFECAYTRYVVGSGLLGDELAASISFISSYDYDRRTIPTSAGYGTSDCTSEQIPGIYTTLSVARASADTILAKLEGWTDEEVPNRSELIGQSAAYAGYSLLLIGEGMCSAAINIGPEMTSAQIFAEAKSRFDKAIAAATAADDETTLHFAQLGRARAFLDLGDPASAATDAAEIPEGFMVAVNTDAADVRRRNLVYVHTIQGGLSSIEPAMRHVMWDTVPDPRVAVTDLGILGSDGHTELWSANKYSTIAAPMPIAKWAEAQLILAEAAVAADQLPTAEGIINVLHTKAGIPAYDASGASKAEVLAQVIEERRRELFLEGHRFGDVRRYDLPLVPAPGSAYLNGGTYGDQRCFPLPDVERVHNPNL